MDTEQPSRHDAKYTFGAGGLFHAIRDLRDCQCLKGHRKTGRGGFCEELCAGS